MRNITTGRKAAPAPGGFSKILSKTLSAVEGSGVEGVPPERKFTGYNGCPNNPSSWEGGASGVASELIHPRHKAAGVCCRRARKNTIVCTRDVGEGKDRNRKEKGKKMIKKSLTVVCGLIAVTILGPRCDGGEEVMMPEINVLKEIPCQDEGVGKRKLVDEDYLLLMQAALKPGQMVPQHNANSNIHLLVVKGEVVVDLAGEKIRAREGDLVPVANGTPMNIVNQSGEDATFLIIKTPHPEKMKQSTSCGVE
ncbi:MAG: cupin domain-containing protein [PVC group bacterium]